MLNFVLVFFFSVKISAFSCLYKCWNLKNLICSKVNLFSLFFFKYQDNSHQFKISSKLGPPLWECLLASRSSRFLFSPIKRALLVPPDSCLLASFFVASATWSQGKTAAYSVGKRAIHTYYLCSPTAGAFLSSLTSCSYPELSKKLSSPESPTACHAEPSGWALMVDVCRALNASVLSSLWTPAVMLNI